MRGRLPRIWDESEHYSISASVRGRWEYSRCCGSHSLASCSNHTGQNLYSQVLCTRRMEVQREMIRGQLLVSKGASLSDLDKNGHTVLHYAIVLQDEEAIRLFWIAASN